MRPIRALVVCGSSVATSTVGVVKLQEEFQDRRIPLDVKQTNITNLRSAISQFRPDFVVCMILIDEDLGVPKINGVPLLTRMGLDQFWKEVFGIVQGIKSAG